MLHERKDEKKNVSLRIG